MICRVLLMPSWMIHHHSMDGTAFLSQYHMFCIVYKTGINWVVPQSIRQYIYSFPLTGDRFYHTTNCCLIIVCSQAIHVIFTLTHNKLANENTIVPASMTLLFQQAIHCSLFLPAHIFPQILFLLLCLWRMIMNLLQISGL